MTPTWQTDDGRVQLYLADCRDVLPHVKADAVVTDPPYGMNAPTNHATRMTGMLCASNDYPPVYGDNAPFDPSPLCAFDTVLVWGANYFSKRLPGGGTWLVWDKRDGTGTNDYADCEIGWHSKNGSARLFRYLWNGCIKHGEKDTRRVHATQKPIELMVWCIDLIGNPETIFDPYMGSGTTGVAAVRLGRRFIGVEIEPKYFEIAVRRIKDAIEQTALYEPTPRYVQATFQSGEDG